MAKKLQTNTGGRGSMDYLNQRRNLKNKAPHGKKETAAAKKEEKKELGAFFKAATLQAPGNCENCRSNLQATINFHPRAHICHIVPKTRQLGGCPSVATHPLNRWFGCRDCHTKYDMAVAEKKWAVVESMPVVKTIRERFTQFKDQIAKQEIKFIPEFLTDTNKTPK